MSDIPKGAPKQAFIGPRGTKEAGSVEWCWQTLDYLKYLWESRNENIKAYRKSIERELAELERHGAHTKIPPDHPYGDLDALLRAELGVNRTELQTTLTREAITQARAEQPAALNGHGGDHKSDEYQQNQDVNQHVDMVIGSSNADYLTARIARDHPDILSDMRAGKYRSVRAAAIDAGIIDPAKTKRYQLPADDPVKAAAYLAERCEPGWIATFVSELMDLVAEKA